MATTETKTFTITATISRIDGGTLDLTNVSLIDLLEKMEKEFSTPRSDNFHQVISTVVVT